MMKYLVISAKIILIVLLGISETRGYNVKSGPLLTKRPPWLKYCRRSDPNLNACLNDLFVTMFPQLAIGIPEMNVDPFEPLYLDRVSVSKGNGPVTLAGSFYDLVVAGPSNATPTYTDLDLPNKKWRFGINIPLLDIKSQYDLKGKVLILPLVGNGANELKLYNVRTNVSTQISLPKVDGREIIRVEKMKVHFTLGGMKINLHNLFNGNKVLGHTVNSFLNQNSLEVVGELQDSIAQGLAEIFTDLINNVYTKMPTDLWLLTDEQYEKLEATEAEKSSEEDVISKS